MNTRFSAREGAALFEFLTDSATDILLKVDRAGEVVNALPGTLRCGCVMPRDWVGRRLADIAAPGHGEALISACDAALAGHDGGEWVEFAITGENALDHWFEVRMRPLRDRGGAVYGVLAVLHDIEERKRFERDLFAATMTDPLTGLTNRTAFVAMLQHLIDRRPDQGSAGCIALFDIDHFKAINLRFGQSVGDEVLVAFAHFVRSAMRSHDIISRVGGESLGVLLPGASPAQAEAICSRVVASIAEIGADSEGAGRTIPITASAGVARIGATIDDTMRAGEVALALAKAKGRNRLEMAA